MSRRVDPDQAALAKAAGSGSAMFSKKPLLITSVNSLDPDQVKSADDKKHRKYPSMQRVKSTGHGFDWKIEHV